MKKFFAFVAAACMAMTMNAITVAEAVTEGMKLDSMGVSEAEYTVEGYVINAGSFNLNYMNQSWYMADDASASASDFQAYNCFPIDGNDTLKVLNGDKVSVTGKLKKYYNKSTQKFIIEIEKGNATFISKTAGDHSVSKTVQEITVAQALTIGAALAANGVSEETYDIVGYITQIDDNSFNASFNNMTFWIADEYGTAATNADGAFEVFRGRPTEELQVGWKIVVRDQIKNFKGNTIETATTNCPVTVISKDVPALKLDTIHVTDAVEIAQALGDNETTTANYAVSGYVAKIKTEFNAQYNNISFYMTDDATSTYGDLQVYRGKISAEDGPTLAAGDRVLVVGKLKHSVYESNGETKSSFEMPAGAQVTVEWKQAIENILMNDTKINKVIVDGVLYIVRDGKIFTVQGQEVK